MTEREYRTRLAASQRVLDQAVELAREAGAVFEPERLQPLPKLRHLNPNGDFHHVAVVRLDESWRYPTETEAVEIVRRCEAVETAAEMLRPLVSVAADRSVPSIYPPSPYAAAFKDLLAVLEGRS